MTTAIVTTRPTHTTPATAVRAPSAAVRAEVKRLRSELAIISENAQTITRIANALFDRYGDDPKRERRYDTASARIAADRRRILDRIAQLLHGGNGGVA